MKNFVIFFLSGFVLITSFRNETGKRYKIFGSVIGFHDSTLIYLDNINSGQFVDIDSTFIIKGKFQFSGPLKEKVLQAAIRTKNYADIKHFWLENTIITFKGEKGKFRNAFITGSRTQSDQDKLDSVIISSGKEKEQDILFIRNHPNSIISAYILSVYSSTWGRDTSAILYKGISKELKNTSYGRNVLEFITLNKNLKTGDKFVDFAEQNSQGEIVKLSDFKDKVVLLDFWGSWCYPCRKGNPELVKIYNEFNDRGFDILGVAAETRKEDWLNAIEKDSLTWQNVTDLKGDKNKAALIYGISYYPANFLIDRNGIIIAKDLTGDALRNKLTQMLK